MCQITDVLLYIRTCICVCISTYVRTVRTYACMVLKMRGWCTYVRMYTVIRVNMSITPTVPTKLTSCLFLCTSTSACLFFNANSTLCSLVRNTGYVCTDPKNTGYVLMYRTDPKNTGYVCNVQTQRTQATYVMYRPKEHRLQTYRPKEHRLQTYRPKEHRLRM